MKPLLLIIFFSLTTYSQLTLDSAQVSRLIIKLNERNYLLQKDSLSEIELSKKDTIISDQEKQLTNKDIIIKNQTIDIDFLRAKVTELEVRLESGLKWWHYGGAAILLTIIGVLIGMQL